MDKVGFMKALIAEVEWQITTRLEGISVGMVEDAKWPDFRWEEEDAVTERKVLADIKSLREDMKSKNP